LTTREVAAAFLDKDITMGQRISRAKDKLRSQQAMSAKTILTAISVLKRIGEDGATVPPESQNRELWDVRAMQEGRELLSQAVQRGRPGPFQIKAAIADCHMADQKTPVVALNWAVAIAEVGQEELALHKVEDLKSELETFQPFHAAYANILSKVGRQGEARNAYDKAIELAQNSCVKALPGGRIAWSHRLFWRF